VLRFFNILVLVLIGKVGLGQMHQTLNTSKEKDNYDEFKIKTLMQINFNRVLNKLRPLKTNNTLNLYSRDVFNSLQQVNKDTTLPNTIIIYYNDTINLNHELLKDTFDLVGMYNGPHQFNCELLVITLDRRKEEIKWKDLDCPRFMKAR
jgi:hypothetical protein